MTPASCVAMGALAIAIIAGRKDARGVYMPHGGWTWSAVVLLAVAHGMGL